MPVHTCERKPGRYGTGVCSTSEDPRKPARVGKLGEIAVGYLLGLEPNFGVERRGDKHDFILNGLSYDIKTNKCYHDYETGLVIKRNHHTGHNHELESDIYVFAFLSKEVVGESANVMVVGWSTREDVSVCPVRPGKISGCDWLNYEVPYESLESVGTLPGILA